MKEEMRYSGGRHFNKSEARNPKQETNPNVQNPNYQNMFGTLVVRISCFIRHPNLLKERKICQTN
jgi:hypothetical protein